MPFTIAAYAMRAFAAAQWRRRNTRAQRSHAGAQCFAHENAGVSDGARWRGAVRSAAQAQVRCYGAYR